MNIIGATQNNERIMGKTIGEFNCSIRMVNPGASGTMTALPNLRQFLVKAVLNRNNKQNVIFENNLQDLLVDSQFFSNLDPVVLGSALVQRGNGQAVLTARLTLHGVIDLQGDDYLHVTVNVLPAAYNGTYHNSAACNFDFDAVETVGVEYAVPTIRTEIIDAGKGNYNMYAGNDVYSVLFINYDLGLGGVIAVPDAQTVVQQANISCTEFNRNYTADRIASDMFRMFPTPATAYLRGQCFIVRPFASGSRMHDLNLTLTLSGVNVTATNNVMVVRQFTQCANTFVRAAAKEGAMNAEEGKRLTRIHGAETISRAQAAHTKASTRPH